MKKFIYGAMAFVMLASCGNGTKPEFNFKAEKEAYSHWMKEFMQKYNAPGANRDSLESVYEQYTQELAEQHIGDSLGLMLTIEAAYDMNRQQLDSAMNLCELYKNDERLQTLSKALTAVENTSAGCAYVDIEGLDANTGAPVKLSDIVAQGKPVVIDFWASWCVPCRNEISRSLAQYAPKYSDKVNFVGIAVWEDTITTTQKAISELPISWPVIFAGSRENSPTEPYGIMGIPQIMLIGADGVIKARDLRGEAIETAILNEIGEK